MEANQYKYVLIPVDFCEHGDSLGEDIFTDGGQLVLSKGTLLTPELIEKLKMLEIFIVRIQVDEGYVNADNVYINDNHKQVVETAYNTLESIMTTLANRKPTSIKEHEKELQDLLQAAVSSGEILDILRQVQAFDDYLYKHSLAVGIYSVMLATWMGLSEKDVKNVGLAGILHDIGMTKIEAAIVKKSGALHAQQKEKIERHVKVSHDIVKFCGFHDASLLNAIMQHHERVDGSGYPKKLKGPDIHPFAHIIAVADCYHAMTTDRVYKKKINHTDALNDLWKEAFTTLDPKIVLTFIHGMMGKYSGRFCKMSDGQAARVVFINRDDPIYPIVRVGKGDESKFIDLRFERNLSIREIL